MNLKHKLVITAASLLMGISAIAQTNDPPVNQNGAVNDRWKPSLTADGVIDRVEHSNRLLETPRIREIDVAWKRRVWRVIDVRQKSNQAFVYEGDQYSGGGAFIEILLNGIKTGAIKAYSKEDDRFTTELDLEQFSTMIGGSVDTVRVINPVTEEETFEITKRPFDINSVTKYRVKEDWIQDRNRGKMVVEIIGLAPLQAVRNPETGDYLGDAAMFWLHYPDIRTYLGKFEVYNPRNDLARMTWADYFDMRYFTSYVYKTSGNNAHNNEFDKGLRGLEDGQRAMDQIYNMSMDMWEN